MLKSREMPIYAFNSHLEIETQAKCDSECECWDTAGQFALMAKICPVGQCR